MSAPITSSGELSDSSFRFLHYAIVQHLQETTPTGAHVHDEVFLKLEHLGFRAGQTIAERLTIDFSLKFVELEIIKFICKEFWVALFGKQIDSLRTNRRGVYVLQDSKCDVFVNMSNTTQFAEEAITYAALPCGLIRGALAIIGLNSVVSPEITTLPSCTFNVKILPTM